MKNILDWIEEKKQQYESPGPRTMAQEPRNMAHGGRIAFADGPPGVKYTKRGLPWQGRGMPGVPKTYKTVSPFGDPETKIKISKTERIKFRASEFGKRLQWIADNGKNYDTPEAFKKAYEKQWDHKIGSKKDALFSFHEGAQGIIKDKPNMKKINYRLVDGMTNPGDSKQPLSMIKKGFSEDELFKGSILQNNSKVKEQFKVLFKDIHNNVSLYSELGPEGIVERLKSKGGGLLKAFDFIDPTRTGTVDIGGVHKGITRNSLLALGVKSEHLVSYQSVRKPLMALSHIIENLKNPSFAKGFGISSTTATKIRGQLENFVKGEGDLRADIKKINATLGDKTFNKVFGGVNFEHTLAKQFGKDYKYLPRNYLLKGQFTTKAFNMMKREAFDLPLIQLMKGYEKGTVSGEKIQSFIDNFNKKTGNYADFSFDADKGRFSYGDSKVSYDLSRYNNPGTARAELIKNIKMTMSPEFQKGMKDTIGTGSQLKLFKSKEAKNLLKMLEGLCPKGKASGGRIGYQTAGAVGSTLECGRRTATKLLGSGTANTEQKQILKEIMRMGSGLMRGAGQMLNPAEFFKLKNLVGPGAWAAMGAFEAGIIGYDTINNNTPLNEALSDNWVTGWAMPWTKKEAQIKNLGEANVSGSPAMQKYMEQVKLMAEYERGERDLKNLKMGTASSVFGVESFRKTDPKVIEAQQAKLDKINNDWVNLQETAMVERDGEMVPVTGGELEFQKAVSDMAGERQAGEFIQEDYRMGNIGINKEGKAVKVNDYGYTDVGDESKFKWIRDKLGLEKTGWFEQGTSEKDLYRKKADVPIYDLPPSEIAKMDPEAPFKQGLDWAPDVKAKLKGVHRIKEPTSYVGSRTTPLDADQLQIHSEHLRDLGYVEPRGEMPQWYIDMIQKNEKWRQLFAQSPSGLHGAAFAGGGIVGIRKPSAIAPTGGPMHQGLRSLYINDKDY